MLNIQYLRNSEQPLSSPSGHGTGVQGWPLSESIQNLGWRTHKGVQFSEEIAVEGTKGSRDMVM